MKTMTIFISLFMLPFIGTTAPQYPEQYVTGFWESECGTISLLIEGDRRGLRVRNPRNRGWTYYDRARGSSNTFVNGRSRSLRIKSNNRILFEDRRNRTRFTLRKKRNRSNQRGFYQGSYDRNGYGDRGRYGNRYDRDNRYDSRNNDRYGRGTYGRGYLEGFDPKKIRRSIDDTWRNRQYDVSIKIKDTDSGIKMKKRGFNKYTHYLQDYRNPSIFSDARGNTIQIVNKNEIVWFDANSGRSIYFARD